MTISKPARHSLAVGGALLALGGLLAQCRSGPSAPVPAELVASGPWETVYRVLQHPRCLNCHPAGDVPLQGDDSRPHAQNVRRGPAGRGLFAMRCDTCHQAQNLPGAHMPPGAPNWHLPDPDMPLIFAGRSSGELCRQLKDPQQNGGRSPENLYQHLAHDPLVLWGWEPGDGRAPVDVSHEDLLRAMRAWIDGGCGCPD